MDLTQYVEELRRQLDIALEAGGEEAQQWAGRLTAALESSARLVLLEALSAAAAEITRDLAPGSVDVRLRGRDPEFVVTSPPTETTSPDVTPPTPPAAPPTAADAASDSEDTGTARITLRLPEHLKARIEEAAGRDGVSVNSWLVRTVSGAVDPTDPGRQRRSTPLGGQHYTGWAR